jgi:pimeloyl-ACP methyl ester carboxylesterase
MKRLGYKQFFAQGGDWGAVVTDVLAVQSPKEVLGIHSNMPGVVPPELDKLAREGAPAPRGLSDHEKQAYDQLAFFYTRVYYAFHMATRPQTLTALVDSPVGLATYMLDHDARSLELITRVFDGQTEGLTRDDVLDNITLFWLTSTAISAARLYWENKLNFFTPKGVTVPVAVSAFPDELWQTPKSWAEQAYPELVYYNRQEKGGHFAAWEQPEALVHDIRAGLKTLRKSH